MEPLPRPRRGPRAPGAATGVSIPLGVPRGHCGPDSCEALGSGWQGALRAPASRRDGKGRGFRPEAQARGAAFPMVLSLGSCQVRPRPLPCLASFYLSPGCWEDERDPTQDAGGAGCMSAVTAPKTLREGTEQRGGVPRPGCPSTGVSGPQLQPQPGALSATARRACQGRRLAPSVSHRAAPPLYAWPCFSVSSSLQLSPPCPSHLGLTCVEAHGAPLL